MDCCRNWCQICSKLRFQIVSAVDDWNYAVCKEKKSSCRHVKVASAIVGKTTRMFPCSQTGSQTWDLNIQGIKWNSDKPKIRNQMCIRMLHLHPRAVSNTLASLSNHVGFNKLYIFIFFMIKQTRFSVKYSTAKPPDSAPHRISTQWAAYSE